jgi:regulatory associated protein of mTOR
MMNGGMGMGIPVSSGPGVGTAADGTPLPLPTHILAGAETLLAPATELVPALLPDGSSPPNYPPVLLRPSRLGTSAPPMAANGGPGGMNGVGVGGVGGGVGAKPSAYTPNRFFADQLTAFEVWISRGGSALTRRGPLSLPVSAERGENDSPTTATMNEFNGMLGGEDGGVGGMEEDGIPDLNGLTIASASSNTPHHLVPRKPPAQLPIVLQVLLSQPHRLRALILLSQFVDLGEGSLFFLCFLIFFSFLYSKCFPY